MSDREYIERLNVRAEQVAFIGRAMEREQVEGSLSDYLLLAALDKAEQVLDVPAPAEKKKEVCCG